MGVIAEVVVRLVVRLVVVVVVAVATVIGTLIAPATASASPADGRASPTQETVDPARELVDRYAPIVVVKQQSGPCDTNGEPFEPMAVDAVLDNPEVFLRQVGNDDPVAMRGPGARDLFDLREGWYLDFPGDALDPGCVFEQDFHRFTDGRAVVYAHIATEEERPGFLALQYWSFWYHNPAKNDHEGDWEFVQVLFEADSIDEALGESPVAVGYAQHTGGERSAWDDPKLELDGDRPVVYAARGSHASYFGSALYLGRSSREGFGCDDTDGPSRRLDPDVELLPDAVTDAGDPLAWLSFRGRWGQREPGFFNGPTGPYAKDRWDHPVTWHEGLRRSSVVIPGGDRFGVEVVNAFCGGVEFGSVALTTGLRSPAVLLVVLVVAVAVAVITVRRTVWRPVRTSPLRVDRGVGQIVRAAWRVWRDHPLAMIGVGLVYLPVAIATSAVEAGVRAIPFVGDLIDLAGDRSGLAFLLTLLVGGVADLLTFVFVVGVVATLIDRPERRTRRPWSVLDRDQLRRLFATVGRATAIVAALLVSVVGIPWGIRQLVRYQVAVHATVLEGHDPRGALRRSSELVRHRWWWTMGVVVTIEGLVLVAGFATSIAILLVVRSVPLWVFSLLSSIVYVFLVPVGAAATTYVYGTLVARPVPHDLDDLDEEPDAGSIVPA